MNERKKAPIREQVHEVVKHPQKFVRYKDGAEMYGMCLSKFQQMAQEANAVYRLNKLCLVNIELFEQYLEKFRVVNGRRY